MQTIDNKTIVDNLRSKDEGLREAMLAIASRRAVTDPSLRQELIDYVCEVTPIGWEDVICLHFINEHLSIADLRRLIERADRLDKLLLCDGDESDAQSALEASEFGLAEGALRTFRMIVGGAPASTLVAVRDELKKREWAEDLAERIDLLESIAHLSDAEALAKLRAEAERAARRDVADGEVDAWGAVHAIRDYLATQRSIDEAVLIPLIDADFLVSLGIEGDDREIAAAIAYAAKSELQSMYLDLLCNSKDPRGLALVEDLMDRAIVAGNPFLLQNISENLAESQGASAVTPVAARLDRLLASGSQLPPPERYAEAIEALARGLLQDRSAESALAALDLVRRYQDHSQAKFLLDATALMPYRETHEYVLERWRASPDTVLESLSHVSLGMLYALAKIWGNTGEIECLELEKAYLTSKVEYYRRMNALAMKSDPEEHWRHPQLSWDSDEDGTYVRTEAKVGRNDPCPCGSGKKHKKCCLKAST